MNTRSVANTRARRWSLTGAGLVCFLAPAVAYWQAAPASSPPPAAAVDAFVGKALAERGVPGASVAVVRDGTVVLAKGYGLADVETGTKATEQTVYPLASVTKPFTAMATLMLVDDGKLSLDAKVTELLPDLPAAWGGVTVRHLLTHTSGIRSYTDVFGAQKVPNDKVFTAEEILALVKDAPLVFAPGERYAYCNTGYYLLGMIIERVSGKPYGTFVRERIFTPLGMTATTLDDYADARPVRAKGYAPAGGKAEPAGRTHPSQPFAAGALISTVADLAKWEAALNARKLLKPASYDLMWTPARFNDGKPSGYALGWQVDTYRTRPRQAHGGGITGFSTFFARFPEDKVTVIVLANQQGNAAGAIANGIAELFIPALQSNAPKPITDADPKTTAMLRAMLAAAATGTADPELLTPEFRGFLLPDRIKEGPQMMGRHGPLNAFELMEETTRDGNRVRVYRAVFGTTPIRATFVLSSENKIGGLRIEPGS
jgi:CubicO group peptidase (beta-lactamase class C family)